MKERRLILTMVVGDLFAQKLASHSVPRMERYASRCEAELRIVRETGPKSDLHDELTTIMLAKLDAMRTALKEFDRVMWIDSDALVRADTPSLFDMVPATHWAAFDEAAPCYAGCGWLGMKHVHNAHHSMVCVARQDGVAVPDSQGRYFNTGIQLAAKRHSSLYAPAPHASRVDTWAEQSRINVRLFLRPELPIYYLPECFNRMLWMQTRNYQRVSYIVHYTGVQYSERPALVAADDALWKIEEGHHV